jgi:hypothetical protein
MTKKVLVLLSFVMVISLFAANSPNQPAYANALATAKATEKPEATREANDSPFCAGITPGAATPEANAPDQQPRAARIAEAYGVSYKEVIGWFCKGFGFGQIDRAYAIAKLSAKSKTPMTVAQVFAQRDAGKGWGEIVSAAGLSMKDVNQARKAAFGKGKGNGNGNKGGNGKGKGNKGNDEND